MTMFTVAFIGPDGSGKTTVARHLEDTLSIPVKYLYMGVSFSSSNATLPTTRLIHAIKKMRTRKTGHASNTAPTETTREHPRRKGLLRKLGSSMRATLRLIILLSEEWYRQGLSIYYNYRGYVVIYDRHFFADYHGFDIARDKRDQPLSRRIHGYMLEHLYPRPDLIIYLDAPGEVLFARKGEKSPEILEDRRQKYINLCKNTKDCIIVDATQQTEKVIADATRMIMDFYNAGSGRK
jgi:thymidylate kinase